MIDLRSDTLTQPTAAMRRAMADADVGDDVYGEDPTVNRLQVLAADLLGTERAMFVAGGTMANQIALRVLTWPGAEVVCEQRCHLVEHEAGAAAALSQVQLSGILADRGVLVASQVAERIRPGDDSFQPRTAAVAVENTHNAAGGTVWPLEAMQAVASLGKPVLLDGARLFNAVVATGVSARDYAACADLTTISLYKGLCAPMGSLICGSRELLDRAVPVRRMFGGAMRMAGVLAAAGIVALTDMVDRLDEDHEHARRLADGIGADEPETNMVLLSVSDAPAFLGRLRDDGVLAGLIAPGVVRFVTHRDVTRDAVDRAVTAIRRAS